MHKRVSQLKRTSERSERDPKKNTKNKNPKAIETIKARGSWVYIKNHISNKMGYFASHEWDK